MSRGPWPGGRPAALARPRLTVPLLGLLTALLVALSPGAAWPAAVAADATPVSLTAYRDRLAQVSDHLRQAQAASDQPAVVRAQTEAARRLLEPAYTVNTPTGPLAADLTPLLQLLDQADPATEAGRQALHDAAALGAAYLSAAETLGSSRPPDLGAARVRLEQALLAAQARGSITRWLLGWWDRLLGHATTGLAQAAAAPWVAWLIFAAGAAGVLVFLWGLVRSLAAHGAGSDTLWRRNPPAPAGRPPTPGERLATARRLAEGGQYKPALAQLHLALLGHLDAVGLLHYDPAQTNREHEQQLRRRLPALAVQLHGLNDRLEPHLFSAQTTAAADFGAADRLASELWREGEAASRASVASTGPSSSAP